MMTKLGLLLLGALSIISVRGWSYLLKISTNLLPLLDTKTEQLNKHAKSVKMTDVVHKCGTLLFAFAAPVFSAQVELPQSMIGTPDAPYSFQFTNDLVSSPKIVKTHQMEIFLKSEKFKGFNVGLTVSFYYSLLSLVVLQFHSV